MKTSRLAHWAIQSGASYRRTHKVASCPGLSHLLMRVVSAFCLITFTLSGAASAWTVAWNSSPETGVAGYRLTYGTQSGNPSDTIDTGMALSTSINGLESGETYYFTVKVLNGDGVQSDPSPELAFTVPVDPNGEPTEIPNNGWSLHFVDSQDTDGYAATQAFDGNPSTFWHTIWKTETTPPPHDLQINLGATYPVTGFRYLPRQDSYTDGNISEYEFYVSEDGTNWGQPVASGTFSATKTEKEILFPQTYARYVRLLSYSDVYGDDATNVAELTVLQGDSGITPPGNTAPVANAGSTNVVEDGQVSITLAANDPENDTLTYTIVSGPSHGTFSGTAPNLSYTPAGGYSGSDSFTFKVNDGEFDSNVATFTIAVTAVNHAPVAAAKSASTAEDSAVYVVLSASDSDGDSLNYSIVSGPSHGALSGNAPNMSYMPASNYNGADSFTYRANDGSLNSNVATFNISVSSVNDAPVASSGSASTSEDSTVSITLSASDREGTALTYTIVNAPAHGTLSGTAPNLSYRPTAGYNGSDSFRFRVNDGDLNSNTATISISISEVNNAPVAASGSASTVEDTAVSINLSASDPEEDVLIYTILSGPAHGSLSGNAPNLTYAPDSDYNGSDSFTFRVNDGSLNSNVATTSISISPKNDAPVATSKAAATSEGDSVAISLSASDKDGDSLTYVVVSGPAHGTLSGSAPNLSYTPANGFNGSDSFTFRANDGTVNSNTATVSISISETNDAPVAAAKSVATQEDKAVSIALSASDPDGDSLNYSIVSGPVHGTLSGNAPNLSYLPASNFNGSDSFTFRANDGVKNSNLATVAITIGAVNDAPVAASASAEVIVDESVSIELTAIDKDGDSLTYTVVSSPSHGTLSGNAPNLSYTPVDDLSGQDSFTFKVSDGTVESNVATVSITVSAAANNSEVISQDGWTLHSVDSASSRSNVATSAFDGDPASRWHTRQSWFSISPPHEIQINLGQEYSIRGFRYLPRQDGSTEGNIGEYEFYVSTDGSNWGSPVATGTFTETAEEREVTWNVPAAARYVRLRALTDASGGRHSNVAELNLIGDAVTNHAPKAISDSLTTSKDVTLAMSLGSSDQDGDPLTYSIVSGPSHGNLSGTAPNLKYTPTSGFTGEDSFTYQVHDGSVNSNVATIAISVTAAANTAPVASSESADTEEGRSVTIMLNASDADGNSLTYSIVSQPAHGTLSGTAPKLTYRPSSKYSGSDSFTFRANDGSVDSNVATISIEVKPKRTWRTNRTPRFFSTWFKRPAGTETESYSATAIAAEVEDPDEGDAIVISKVAGPTWLKVSPSGALSGVPPASAVGVNRFKVRATDLAGAAAESEMVITVLPADLPLPWNMKMLGGGQMTEPVSYRSRAFHIESSGRLGKSKDAGSYIYRSLSGDGEITARVKAFDSANGNSRAGVMIRKSLAANSKYAFIGVNGKGGYRWMGRSATGKKSFGKSRSAGNIPNVWVRLVRKGNTITAYTKGKNSKWKKVRSTKIKLGKNCYVGLLSSGEKGKDNAAVFNSVKVKR
jgi:regulation of enolase protein 1 (concanavalin A-like superfamily)